MRSLTLRTLLPSVRTKSNKPTWSTCTGTKGLQATPLTVSVLASMVRLAITSDLRSTVTTPQEEPNNKKKFGHVSLDPRVPLLFADEIERIFEKLLKKTIGDFYHVPIT